MVFQAKDAAVVDALAFEDATRIMQAMAQHMQLGVAPRNQSAVIPDEAVTIVEREHGHEGLPSIAPDATGLLAELYNRMDAPKVTKVAR